jgi:hypothetical protein
VSELEEFVNRELELKRTLPFRDWLRHIKDSHERLCQMVRAGQRIDKPLRVEVMEYKPGVGITISTYELPAECRRVVIDVQKIYGTVYGFCQTDTPGQDRQVNGHFKGVHVAAIVGTPVDQDGADLPGRPQ